MWVAANPTVIAPVENCMPVSIWSDVSMRGARKSRGGINVQCCVPIELGWRCSIYAGVILGYPPARAVERKPVRIGDNARIRSGSVVYASSPERLRDRP